MTRTGRLRFGWIEEPPFNFRGPGDVPGGHDIELARLVAARLGLEFEPVETGFAALLPGLSEGSWQMTTGMFVTPARAALVRFTRSIWRLADGLLVAAGNPHRLDGYAGLAGTRLRLAVVAGQVQAGNATATGVTEPQLVTVPDYAAAVRLVRAGTVAAFASVARAHAQTVAGDPGLAAVTVPAAECPPAPGAFALVDAGLHAAVDAVLGEIQGTTIHRNLQARFGLA